MKIYQLIFQRNGVHGEGFYHCHASIEEGKNFLITFQTGEDDKEINIRTCRAVNLDDLTERWRGDEIAFRLQKHFSQEIKQSNGTIYDKLTKAQ
jgi:hypothetical protein